MRRITLLAIGTVLLFFVPNISHAQSGWRVDIGAERSKVTIHDSDNIWRSQHLEVGWVREESGGWFAGIENQERFGLRDVVFHTNAYRRLGDWALGGGIAGTQDADFWFRHSFEGEISRRIAGSVVASGAYRYMEFPDTTVRQPQMALTWYHRRGEVQGRVFLTHNSIRDGYSATGLIKSSYRFTPLLQCIGSVAYGDRIFDIESLAGGPATAWMARGAFRFNITPRYAIEFGGGFAREKPQFEQQTVAISIRRSF
jgi:YaiO family outer membrane protein